jgi:hypothetical protein
MERVLTATFTSSVSAFWPRALVFKLGKVFQIGYATNRANDTPVHWRTPLLKSNLGTSFPICNLSL